MVMVDQSGASSGKSRYDLDVGQFSLKLNVCIFSHSNMKLLAGVPGGIQGNFICNFNSV